MSDKKAPKGTMKKVLKVISGYKFSVFISLLTALLSVILTLYIPLLFGNAIDLITEAGKVNFAEIKTELIKTVISAVLCGMLTWVMNFVNNAVTCGTVKDIRNEVFEKLNSLPLSFIDSHPTGDIVSRMIADADQFADGLLMGFTQLFTGIMTIIGTLIFMLKLSPVIAITVVILTPASLFTAKYIANHTYKFFREQSKVRAEQTAMINEFAGNLKTVKAFSKEHDFLEKFGIINENLKKTSLKAIFYSSITNPSTRFINAIVYAAVAFVGAWTVIKNPSAMTVGMLTCVLSYANQYTKPFNEISGVAAELQNTLACAARIFELTEEEPEIPDCKTAPTDFRAEGNMEICGVDFSYDKSSPLIKDFNISVKKGQKVAIVGPTGCGKTTFINLLMRFYDVDRGSIKIDGTDIRELPRAVLRSSFGMVLQDTWLKEGTVRENITMGAENAGEEEIIKACKMAHSWSFIRRLPQGLDTFLSEDGGSLSQGQKQLLCITRVMLCHPPILILDEATSSIDTRTEIRIQKAFFELMRNKTSFVVAHRLSTILNSDIILVMDKGRIIEQGTHEELLSKNGFYTKLFNSQFDLS